MGTAPGDLDARLRELQPAAEAGDVAAMGRISAVYVTKNDWAAAEPWARRAAEGGDILGMQILAGALVVRGDEAGAEQWSSRALEATSHTLEGRAIAHMTAPIIERYGGEPDEEQVRRDAQAGDEVAMTVLGLLLWEREPEEAERWLTPRAEAGDTTAMFALGSIAILRGDEETGTRWAQRAAQGGEPVAMHVFGGLLERLGDHERAQHWARAAQDADTAEAAEAAEVAEAADAGSPHVDPGE